MRRIFILLFLVSVSVQAQQTYTVDTTIFANPERGLVYPLEYTTPSDSTGKYGVDSAFMAKLRLATTSETDLNNPSVPVTVIYLINNMNPFINGSAISAVWLSGLNHLFSLVRAAGAKVVMISNYGSSSDPQFNPDTTVIRQHIGQLESVVTNNNDVIAAHFVGFIGAWGEWAESTPYNYQGDTTAQRKVINEMVLHTPSSSFLLLRSPRHKRYFLRKPFTGTVAAMDASKAFDGSPEARLGFHNDSYNYDASDAGTFVNYVGTTLGPTSDTTFMKPYTRSDSKYTPHYGEIARDYGYNWAGWTDNAAWIRSAAAIM